MKSKISRIWDILVGNDVIEREKRIQNNISEFLNEDDFKELSAHLNQYIQTAINNFRNNNKDDLEYIVNHIEYYMNDKRFKKNHVEDFLKLSYADICGYQLDRSLAFYTLFKDIQNRLVEISQQLTNLPKGNKIILTHIKHPSYNKEVSIQTDYKEFSEGLDKFKNIVDKLVRELNPIIYVVNILTVPLVHLIRCQYTYEYIELTSYLKQKLDKLQQTP